MRNLRRRLLPLLAVLLLLCSAMTVTAFAADDPTEESGTKMIECTDCGAVGIGRFCVGIQMDVCADGGCRKG